MQEIEANAHYAKLDATAAADFFREANELINKHEKEDVLRYFLCTKLSEMFPSIPWWISAHAKLAEANSTFLINDATHSGFVDVLIGKTAVEYEKDLTVKAIFDHGYYQVKEYCAGLLNEGVDSQDIIGVLSDTVNWYSYFVELKDNPLEKENFGPDDIVLIERENISLKTIDDKSLQSFERFINEIYGRLGSRKLTSRSLSNDFGLTSKNGLTYLRNIRNFVEKASENNKTYIKLIKNLWDGFVNGLTKSDYKLFLQDYEHELYMVVLARLICANVLNKKRLDEDRETLKGVVDGSFFRDLGIENFVEYDYFGWLCNEPYLSDLTGIACEIQHSLVVYDFKDVNTEDLFGPLLSQLAAADRRMLLGQAPTPQWLASQMVEEILGKIKSESAHLLDMCCGSGVFIVEVLKAYLNKFQTPDHLTSDQSKTIYDSITGIDIDPLAVVLAKANWLIVMRPYIGDFAAGLHIPIYHADSMFAATPVSRNGLSGIDATEYSLNLDGLPVKIPSFLFLPDNMGFCNAVLDSCDRVAISLCESNQEFSHEIAIQIVDQTIAKHNKMLEEYEYSDLILSMESLGSILLYLHKNGRNGIWPFVLSNGFIPELMKNKFDGIVSNPPWLTLSRIQDNPYKDILRKKSIELGVKPAGSTFLHIELSTVFFIGSINRYLNDNGVAACVLPKSLLNGRHEESFRSKEYLKSESPTMLSLIEIWQTPKNTFNNSAVVVFARKESESVIVPNSNLDEIEGRTYESCNDFIQTKYALITNGNVSAYTSNGANLLDAYDKLPFIQGFDAFPRTALFFNAKEQENGSWTLSSIPTQGSALSYVLSDSKKAKDFAIPEIKNVDKRFIFETVISKQVMPFVDFKPLKIFLPIVSSIESLRMLDDIELSLLSGGSRNLINYVLSCTDGDKPCFSDKYDYLDKINIRNKLQRALDNKSQWIVVYGAGGENLAATLFKCTEIRKFAPDQTVYWYGCESYDEAIFYTALLNSSALNKAIKEFQPDGNFGKRHIHTLPLMFIPKFDPINDLHSNVVRTTKQLKNEIADLILNNEKVANLVDPSMGTLSRRRTAFRNEISTLDSYREYEDACNSCL